MLDHGKFSNDHACQERIIVTVPGVITNYLSATSQFVEQIISNKFMATSGTIFCRDIQMHMTDSG